MKLRFLIFFLLSSCSLITKEIPIYFTTTDTLMITDTLTFRDTLMITDTLTFRDTLRFTDTLSFDLSQSLQKILDIEDTTGNIYFIFQNINDSSLKYIPFKEVKYIKDSTKQYFGILPK